MSKRTLEPPRAVTIEVVRDRSAESAWNEGFVQLRRLTLRNRYDDGSTSNDYAYDIVEREAMDAVALVLEGDGPSICLRSSVRPPLAFRPVYNVPVSAVAEPALWEIPAGLVEPEERGEAGLRACASRETLEEVGVEIAPDAFESFGPGLCLSPGVIAEKLHFLYARVDARQCGTGLGDGSSIEERAEIRFVPLKEALEAVRDGSLFDVKTEVAVRRLAERHGIR